MVFQFAGLVEFDKTVKFFINQVGTVALYLPDFPVIERVFFHVSVTISHADIFLQDGHVLIGCIVIVLAFLLQMGEVVVEVLCVDIVEMKVGGVLTKFVDGASMGAIGSELHPRYFSLLGFDVIEESIVIVWSIVCTQKSLAGELLVLQTVF